VAIDGPTYRHLKAFLLDRATHRSAENLAIDFAQIPYARYAPVRRQLLNLLRAVNDVRARTGYEPLPHSVLKLRRRIYRPFEPTGVRRVSDTKGCRNGLYGMAILPRVVLPTDRLPMLYRGVSSNLSRRDP